ncbi:hypothetical protein TIFTF001_032239 [Ficus carica]|uniref:Uncharacterized protein n=1 Tax=Ficus carica TaxID=3494 RepID=A0AA88J690_FICCA|nr:hypothetical protein TIFTF001_032239 [Ficus carica]
MLTCPPSPLPPLVSFNTTDSIYDLALSSFPAATVNLAKSLRPQEIDRERQKHCMQRLPPHTQLLPVNPSPISSSSTTVDGVYDLALSKFYDSSAATITSPFPLNPSLTLHPSTVRPTFHSPQHQPSTVLHQRLLAGCLPTA